ncbi:MAG: alpha-glucan family phosphorylase [Ignavibacteriae bacterium]|nr:alpha-glucan family phosphorylase [Ignavibacteriota bacterium]NOG97920.1 alpha-glucan family phosphorylase [Ignavibacteriota bacterium]
MEFRKPVYSFLPSEQKEVNVLMELALDLRWSWDYSADEMWRQFDPELWDITRNPWAVLQTVSKEHFQELISDPLFRKKIDFLVNSRKESNAAPAWFQKHHPNSPLKGVAYFCMEFMLTEGLPIYSGGLGNVAGDQMKTASDLGVPVVGIGLLYQQGYFRQKIDYNGDQQALYPFNDPGQLPISPLRQANGEWLRLKISLPGYPQWLRVWQAQVGRTKLYLLDSNDVANFPVHRGTTSELYGGGTELRFKQEMILGIGGWRLLEELGIEPQVCHLNEGHAAFAILERARSYMEKTGVSFDEALTVTRAGNLFTTHTAVPAGFDLFPASIIEQYLGNYAEKMLGITREQLLALGRKNPNDHSEPFNMAYLAIRGSGAVNGVSRLHGKVSRRIFGSLFQRWPADEVPVDYVTNGVHVPTWDSKEADEIWTDACGKDRWLGTNKTLEKDIRKVSDERLWEMRTNANQALIQFARKHFARQLQGSGHPIDAVERARQLFSPNVLTLGFARRFATYKRPNLLLSHPQRLLRLLTNPTYPVQLVIAGKAHPADGLGQALIKEWIQFIRQNGIHTPVIFLSDYDIHVGENLVQGVDVWINTPRRPWEASGTSGMKVLVNGGINLSELDGWWAEAYTPEVGWAIGDGNEHGDDPAWDAIEAEQLFSLLENEIVPEFYERNKKGIPTAWVARMRESMAQLTPRFSADRTVREYTEKHYIPAAKAYMERAARKGKKGMEIVKVLKTLQQHWDELYFGEMKISSTEKHHDFEVEVTLNTIDSENVKVELYANGINGEEASIIAMTRGSLNKGNRYTYNAKVASTRPASDYTARIIPNVEGVSVPLESNLILWQR